MQNGCPRTHSGTLARAAAVFAALLPVSAAPLSAADGASAPPPKRALVAADLYRVRTVSDPQLSPDGRWVAYVVSTPSRERDADETDLWLVPWQGGTPRRLTFTTGNEHSPRWSPDGRQLAFLSDREPAAATTGAAAEDQIWVLDLAGGEAAQRSRVAGGISDYAWSPDGRRWAAAVTHPTAISAPAAAPASPAPIVIDRLEFKRDGDGWLGEARTQIALIEAAAGAVTLLTRGPGDAVQPVFSPDGRSIAFLTKAGPDPDAHDDWNLQLIDARPGATPRTLTRHPGVDGDPWLDWASGPPRFSPDGRRIALIRGGDPADFWFGLLGVAMVGSDGSAERLVLPDLDRNSLDPRWAPDGRGLWFRLEDDRTMQLARVDLASGAVRRVTPPTHVITQFDVGADDRAVVVATAVDQPTELAAVTPRGLRWLTAHNATWLAEVDLQPAQRIEAPVADSPAGVHALLIEPRGPRPASGWPTLLRLHGGPVAQHQDEFDFGWQLFAAGGYAVVAPNPRGSTGRGYQFQKALFARWGDVDVKDVLAMTDSVVARGIADPARLGVGGFSYGAMLTNYVIASTPRFRVATSGAGMANILAAYGTDQYARGYETEIGLPWQNTELWLRLSYPFLQAQRITTPTLFFGGSDDFNVPLLGSEQMYQALRRLGVATQLVIYPGEDHSFDRPSFRVDRLERYLDWYGRHLPTR
jgi:dipeptidyl aminopeptidase/acylaminoacyl peptidase